MVRYKSVTDAVGGEMEGTTLEDIEEIDTIIAELEISKGKGNLILCVVNAPAYRNRIIQALMRRFSSKIIFVDNGEKIISTLESRDFNSVDILIWIMPEEPNEDLLSTLNNFRELFYDVKIPHLMFYNQTFSESVIREAPDFWRYRGNYYKLKEAGRGIAFEALEPLVTTLSYQSKKDLLRRKRINEYLLKKVRDKKEKSTVLFELGIIFDYLGELDKSLDFHKRALKLNEELGRKEVIAGVVGNIGLVYESKGELDKALEYFEKSLKLHDELGIKVETATSLGNIGTIYGIKGEFDKALEYFEKSLELYEELGNKEGIASMLGNMGLVYHAKGELDKALEYFKKSLELYEESGEKVGIASVVGNIGLVYHAIGELDKALEYFKKALKIFKEMGMKIEIGRTLRNICRVFLIKGDTKHALDYYREARDLGILIPEFESEIKKVKRLEKKR